MEGAMSKKTKEPLKEGEEPQGEHEVVLEPPLVLVRDISNKDIMLFFIGRMFKATLDKGSKEQGGPMKLNIPI
jgi:hypothetical protein